MVAEYRPNGDIKTGWEFVSRRAFMPYRAFLISAGEWTAFFDNHSREFLAQAELYVLCDRLAADTCFFGCDNESAHFCFDHKDGAEVKERQVMVYFEDHWVFSEQGEPLPFEDLTAYKRPRKKERLTPEILQAGESAEFGRDICLLRWRDFNKKK